MLGPAVLLDNPKYPHNLGQIVRACACYGVSELFWTGDRINLRGNGRKARLPREERLRKYRSVSYGRVEPLDEFHFLGRVPVAVEIRNTFQFLPTFEHPEDALYLFGPEDGSLSKRLISQAHAHIVIPTRFCLNLAASVYTVLYDREFKRLAKGETPLSFELGELAGLGADCL